MPQCTPTQHNNNKKKTPVSNILQVGDFTKNMYFWLFFRKKSEGLSMVAYLQESSSTK
jgi:hypothetical protein